MHHWLFVCAFTDYIIAKNLVSFIVFVEEYDKPLL